MRLPKKPDDEFLSELSFHTIHERAHAWITGCDDVYPGKVIFIPSERQMTLSRLLGRPPEDFIP